MSDVAIELHQIEKPEFTEFSKPVEAQWSAMCKDHAELYAVDVSRDDLWDAYLSAFPQGTNEIFRERGEYDCSCCRHFVKNLGNVVAVKNNQLVTIWDNFDVPFPFDVVTKTMSERVRTAAIERPFRTRFQKFGEPYTTELVDDSTRRWNHFCGMVPRRFLDENADTTISQMRSTHQVFQRALNEITPDAVRDVRDLIEQNTLYRGEEHKDAVVGFQALQSSWRLADNKSVFEWANFDKFGARIRNSSIGQLLQDLSADVELEQAVKKFEAMVAPQNYKRPNALITQGMIDKAVTKLEQLGLSQAVERRYARY